jgi:outer membrane protein insertion porin family
MIQTILCVLYCLGFFEIGDVRIEGLRWAESENVVARLGLYSGDRVDREFIQDAVKRLSQSDQFESVEVTSDLRDSIIDLTLSVIENPSMGDYVFQGNTHVKTEDLVDTLHLALGEYVSDRKLFDWRKTIQRYYKGKGFLRSDAEVEVSEPDSTGSVRLTFLVHEGTQYRIQEIDILGNAAFSDPTLEIKMQNRERNWWRKGKFREDLWEEDMSALEEFYHDHGFPHARVDSFNFDYRDRGMYIQVYVDEGRRFTFGDVDFEGNTIYTSDQLRSLVPLKSSPGFPGSIFSSGSKKPKEYSKKELDDAVMNIAGVYGDSGFLYVGVQPVERVRGDTLVDVTFDIEERHRVKVRRVDIEGNTKTKDFVIRRELDVLPDFHFNRQLAIKSQRDLYFLNYFEDVGLDFKPTDDSSYIDLIFKVKEKPTGNMGMGVSYSGPDGLFGYLQYQQPNLFGNGRNLAFTVEYGSNRKNYSVSFTEPWLGGRPYLLGFYVHDMTTYRTYYDEHRLGGSVYFARPLWDDYWTLRLSYTLERVFLFGISEAYKQNLGVEGNPFLSSAVSATIKRDSRDRSFNASQGSRYSYMAEIVGGPFKPEHLSKFPGLNAPFLLLNLTDQKLGTPVNYQTHILEGNQYFPHLKKMTLVARSKVGLVKGLYKFDEVPVYAKFWLGDVGAFGLRGYGYWSVGPGQLFGIFTLEERFRISESAYLMAFAEAGDAWKNWGYVGYSSLKRSAGVGIRLEMPLLGIIGLDVAYGFDNEGGRWKTHLQFGSMY